MVGTLHNYKTICYVHRFSLLPAQVMFSLNETILSLFETEQMCYFRFLLLASQLI